MDAYSRDDVDLKLQNLELRIENRLQAIELAIAQLNEKMDAVIKTVTEQTREIRSLKVTVVIATLGSVLAVAALNASLYSNMLAAFNSGRATGAERVEIKRMVDDSRELSEQAQRQFEASQRHFEASQRQLEASQQQMDTARRQSEQTDALLKQMKKQLDALSSPKRQTNKAAARSSPIRQAQLNR
jgi:chromosome segregation ATPase